MIVEPCPGCGSPLELVDTFYDVAGICYRCVRNWPIVGWNRSAREWEAAASEWGIPPEFWDHILPSHKTADWNDDDDEVTS